MFIKKIKDFDSESNEADIIVSDGEYEILCHAWTYAPNKDGRFSLSAFMVENVERNDVEECVAVPNSYSFFAYDLAGKLLENGKVAIGDIYIEIDMNSVPKDIKANEYIKFTCLRVDFFQE